MTPTAAGRTGDSRLATRAAVAVLAAVAAIVGSLALPVQPAHATSFRFWSYWIGVDAGWSFATQGPARVPKDGTVDGWRFAVSPATGSSTPPRATARFDDVCGDTAPVADRKRVGLVIDFGTSGDAPAGQAPPGVTVVRCVVVPVSATGYQVLDAVGDLRVKVGLVCGIDGYPATGCGEPVADTGSTGGGSSPSGGSTGSAGGTDSGKGSGASSPPTSSASASPSPSGGKTATKGTRTASASPPDDATEQQSAPPTVAALPSADPAAAEAIGGSGPSPALWAGVLVVVALGATAVAVGRRRR